MYICLACAQETSLLLLLTVDWFVLDTYLGTQSDTVVAIKNLEEIQNETAIDPIEYKTNELNRNEMKKNFSKKEKEKIGK